MALDQRGQGDHFAAAVFHEEDQDQRQRHIDPESHLYGLGHPAEQPDKRWQAKKEQGSGPRVHSGQQQLAEEIESHEIDRRQGQHPKHRFSGERQKVVQRLGVQNQRVDDKENQVINREYQTCPAAENPDVITDDKIIAAGLRL